jgi:hypothetical protein
MTKDEAKKAVDQAMRARQLTTPMTSGALLQFCQEMYLTPNFRSGTNRLQDIREWAKRWQDR